MSFYQNTGSIMKDFLGFMMAMIITAVAIWLCFWLGISFGRFTVREQAIEAEVGTYYIDEDNIKQFKFLTKEIDDAE